MSQTFTPEDLVQYLYKETSPQETAAIEQALATDWTLREKFEVIRKAHARLNEIRLTPRTETILKILKYAERDTVSQN